MNRVACIVSLMAVSLCGCASTDTKEARDADSEAKRSAHDHVLCQSYGFGKSAEDAGHCMQLLKEQRAASAHEN